MKKILTLLVLSCLFSATNAWAANFTDTQNHWAQAEIERLTTMGAAGGYPDGSFRPDGMITRAEFAKILNKVMAYGNGSATAFADCANHWAAGDIGALIEAGIVKPAEYGEKFVPDGAITRQEMAVMLVRAYGLDRDGAALANVPTGFADDASIAPHSKGYLLLAREFELVSGYPDGTFRPSGEATRAEACAMMGRLVSLSSAASNTQRPVTPPENPPTSTEGATIRHNDFTFTVNNVRTQTINGNSIGQRLSQITFDLTLTNGQDQSITLSDANCDFWAVYDGLAQSYQAPLKVDNFTLTLPANSEATVSLLAWVVLPEDIAAQLALGHRLTGFDFTLKHNAWGEVTLTDLSQQLIALL